MNRVGVSRARQLRAAAVVLTASAIAASCGSSSGAKLHPLGPTVKPKPETSVTLLTYSAFTPPKGVFALFTRDTGIRVDVLQQGDGGSLINQAVLTRDHPQGDVLYGVDNTFLSVGLDSNVFAPTAFRSIDALAPAHRDLFAEVLKSVMPIDYGDVCLNYDIAWFSKHKLAPPASRQDLLLPKYKGLTVVENPATSSTGLAFLIATIGTQQDQGWKDYWRSLKANGVQVVDDWTTAYETEFTGGGGKGTRPIVVSYASSPPADVVFSEGKKTKPSIAAVTNDCFRQYEFAGVLKGAKHPTAAARLVEFMMSAPFQAALPLSNYVFPTRARTALPLIFRQFAAVPEHPLTIDYVVLGRHRSNWIRDWTSLMGG